MVAAGIKGAIWGETGTWYRIKKASAAAMSARDNTFQTMGERMDISLNIRRIGRLFKFCDLMLVRGRGLTV